MNIYYVKRGAHYHMRIFMNGKCGDLCCGEKDWEDFRAAFSSKVAWFNEDDTNDKRGMA